MTTTITETIRATDAEAADVRCGVNHSGNHAIVLSVDRTWGECQGCTTFYTAHQIRAAKPGQIGQGGVIK